MTNYCRLSITRMTKDQLIELQAQAIHYMLLEHVRKGGTVYGEQSVVGKAIRAYTHWSSK